MMIEKVMIQLGAKSPTNSGGVGGGRQTPMMIEEVMIQKGPTNIFKKKQPGVISSSAARPHGTSEDSNTGKLIPVKRQPPPP